MSDARKKHSVSVSDSEADSVQAPGSCGTLQDPAVSTTLGAGQAMDVTPWKKKYVMVECETNDVLIVFKPWVDGALPAPSATYLDETVTAKDAASPSFIVPERIYAGAPPRAMVVPDADGSISIIYKSVTGTAKLRVKRG